MSTVMGDEPQRKSKRRSAEERGVLWCRGCGETDTRWFWCNGSRDLEGRILRYRECRKCGYRWRSLEINS